MAENENEKQPDYGDDDDQENGFFRWMSAFVVLLAVAGFFGLAWYAYKSGGEAVDEKDAELVRADKAPIKEAPANPGGMQIPNQDKTVYGLIGGKAPKPTVERVLPAPEEPLARGGETETWMSDRVKSKADGDGALEKSANETPAAVAAQTTADSTKAEQFNPAKLHLAQTDQQSSTEQGTNPKPVVPAPLASPAAVKSPADQSAKPEVKAATAPVPTPASVTQNQAGSQEEAQDQKTPAVENPKPVSTASGKPPAGPRVQLGAYKSEAEAKHNWAKIAKEFSDNIGDKEHYIVRADLGDKGVFYRLQMAPFKSSKEADEFCLAFVSAGQDCFPAKAK